MPSFDYKDYTCKRIVRYKIELGTQRWRFWYAQKRLIKNDSIYIEGQLNSKMQIIVRNIVVLILSFALCLLCGFLYFLYLIKKYIPNIKVGENNESSKSMMFVAPALIMAMRPILLSLDFVPVLQFFAFVFSCVSIIMTVEWGTRAYLAKLYNLK